MLIRTVGLSHNERDGVTRGDDPVERGDGEFGSAEEDYAHRITDPTGYRLIPIRRPFAAF